MFLIIRNRDQLNNGFLNYENSYCNNASLVEVLKYSNLLALLLVVIVFFVEYENNIGRRKSDNILEENRRRDF